MFCRKCLKQGKKVNMKVDLEEEAYECLSCGHRIKWVKLENEED